MILENIAIKETLIDKSNNISLPCHWKICADENFFDDGRDYDKPQYWRIDELARIYHNEDMGSKGEYEFAIALDDAGDGECTSSLEKAIEIADKMVEYYYKFPRYLIKCSDCKNIVAPVRESRADNYIIPYHFVDSKRCTGSYKDIKNV